MERGFPMGRLFVELWIWGWAESYRLGLGHTVMKKKRRYRTKIELRLGSQEIYYPSLMGG